MLLVSQKIKHKSELIFFFVKRYKIRDNVCAGFDFLLCHGKIWFVNTFNVTKLREEIGCEFSWQLSHICFWNTSDWKSIDESHLNLVWFYVNDSSTLPPAFMFNQAKLVQSEGNKIREMDKLCLYVTYIGW